MRWVVEKIEFAGAFSFMDGKEAIKLAEDLMLDFHGQQYRVRLEHDEVKE